MAKSKTSKSAASKSAASKSQVPDPAKVSATAHPLGAGSIPGSSAKDKKYLKKIIDAIEGDIFHPRNMGIAMQAHHVISGEGMVRAKIGSDVEATGYNINHLNNLAFIPCTLEGACFLGIQPHRGNHTAEGLPLRIGHSDELEDQNDYLDDECHGKSYHNKVAKAILNFARKHTLTCTGDSKLNAERAIKGLDEVSIVILSSIQNEPENWPLTSIAKQFVRGGKGCGGVKSVINYDKVAVPCSSNGIHNFFNKKNVQTLPAPHYMLKFEKKKGFK